jgi:hypothetical protein
MSIDKDQRDPKDFRPNLSRRSVVTVISNIIYDLDDANLCEQQSNISPREKLLGRFSTDTHRDFHQRHGGQNTHVFLTHMKFNLIFQ